MTYALIGTGNMAWFIASRMLGAGHTCVGVWGRNSAAAQSLCDEYYLPRITTLSQLNDGPDAIIMAVSDSAIAEVAKTLQFRHSTLIHTGGSVPMNVLDGRSLHTGVVWPVYSIRKASLPSHRGFSAIIEGNSRTAWETVRAVSKAICDGSYEASSEQRAQLHLAAVIGNNFVNHLLGIAADISAQQGTPISVLQPLIEQTINDLRTQHPTLTQTGPAKRGDTATMELHLNMLAAQPCWQELYRAVSASIMSQYGAISREKDS
jgi:predicted short-subunit dehydrogenase-like oxidoreductase (DUF2520 family)